MQFRTLLIATLCAVALGAVAVDPESPINKVVSFIEDLKKDVTKDMEKEQGTYDKYVDWCEETISTANSEIAEAKKIIDEQTAIIEKMSGKGGASGAEIAYLKKSIIENNAAQKEAKTIRKKEETKYLETKATMDSGIEAMKDMIKSLTSPDNSKAASFLSTGSEGRANQVRQVIARALNLPAFHSKLSMKELQSLRSFAQGDIGLMQVQVGDAPESNLGGVINLVQQTLEDYEHDLSVVVKEENEKVDAYTKLMAQLTEELANMQETLAEQESLSGNSAKALADAKVLREETEKEKKADEKVLVETQDSCKLKKDQFDARKKLREEELAGIVKALEILTSDDAKQIFGGAAKVSFLQISDGSDQDARRELAYSSIKALAAKYKDVAMVQLAMKIQRGHFDKVIDIVDKQIEMLRAEEQTDEDHRDRCQKQLAENEALIQELTHTVGKHQTKVDRLTSERDDVKADYDVLLQAIEKSEKEIQERGEMRDEERANHLENLDYDKKALATLNDAIVSINAFFKNNKISLSLAQGQPKFQKAPDAGFSDTKYEGNKQATSGLLSLMDMVREDMENEIEDTKKADAKDQAQYEKDYSAMKSKLDTQNKAKVSTEKALADLDERISSVTDKRDETTNDNNAAKDNKAALEQDCDWVKTNFASRRAKRQAEIEGLVEAKGLLAKGGVR